MATTPIPDLERLAFFPGQRLGAADLTELLAAQRELRWLHNRALHGWGIGLGLGVRGERGERSVTVEPGFGVDCRGREILLAEERRIQVPAVAAGPGGGEAVYFLVAVYVGDDQQAVAERRPGVCRDGGAVRLADEPALEWRTPNELAEGEEIVLAQAWIQNCQLNRPLSLEARRSARPLDQPYIAAGQTPANSTPWQTWQVGSETVGVEVRVDTSSARFRSTPRYSAHVAGERLFDAGHFGLHLFAGFASVLEATPRSFLLRVHLPPMGTPPADTSTQVNTPNLVQDETFVTRVRENLKWHVVWMGVEG